MPNISWQRRQFDTFLRSRLFSSLLLVLFDDGRLHPARPGVHRPVGGGGRTAAVDPAKDAAERVRKNHDLNEDGAFVIKGHFA